MEAAPFTDDPLRVYLHLVSQVPPLGDGEETELFRHIQASDERAESSRKRLVETHLAMVVSVAEGYRERGAHILDLIQRGNEGLMIGIDTFAASPGISFAYYAAVCVRHAIENLIAESGA